MSSALPCAIAALGIDQADLGRAVASGERVRERAAERAAPDDRDEAIGVDYSNGMATSSPSQEHIRGLGQGGARHRRVARDRPGDRARASRAGARVAITGRDQAALDNAAAQLSSARFGARRSAPTSPSRTKQRSAVDAASSAFGGLDILVNNAGVGSFANVADLALDDWNRMIGTNLTGVFYCCRAAIPALRAAAAAGSSTSAACRARSRSPAAPPTAPSKAGLNAFSDALMQEVRTTTSA